MSNALDEEAAEKQKKKNVAAAAQAQAQAQAAAIQVQAIKKTNEAELKNNNAADKSSSDVFAENDQSLISSCNVNPAVFQGVFCRDLAVVGNLLTQVGFNRPIPVKYEALSC
jgi:hypothetical protein